MVGPAVRDPGAAQIDESFAELSGRIDAAVQQSADRSLRIVRLDEMTPESSSPTRVKLIWRGSERQIFHGDRIGFRARLRTPTGSLNPGGLDYAAYLERQGIAADKPPVVSLEL